MQCFCKMLGTLIQSVIIQEGIRFEHKSLLAFADDSHNVYCFFAAIVCAPPCLRGSYALELVGSSGIYRNGAFRLVLVLLSV